MRWWAAVLATGCLMGVWAAQPDARAYAATLSPGTGTSALPCSATGAGMFPSAHMSMDDRTPMVMPGHQLELKSSVQVDRQVLRDAYEASRTAYTQKLQKYAKCSLVTAKQSVVAAHPGMKVEGLQLRNIRTSLVYVSVVSDDQDKYLVVVDAGNGKVLMDRRLQTHHERVFAGHD